METKHLSKSAKNSTFLHPDSFEIYTGKLQYNESVLVSQLQEKLSYLEYYQNIDEHIAEESDAESEIIFIQHVKYNTQKYNTKIQHKIYNMKNTTQKLCFLSVFFNMPLGWCYLSLIEIAYSGVHFAH